MERDPQGSDSHWRVREKQLYKHQWMVYAKMPLGGPAQVLAYLSRYAHRTAISNERIRHVSETEVAFNVRADEKGGKRLVRLDGVEFVRRFMLHVLPAGIKRIRHYGVLASGCKAVKLAQARQALQMPAPNALAMQCAQAFMARVADIDINLCPACQVGRLRAVAVMKGSQRLPAPGHVLTPNERGPPREA